MFSIASWGNTGQTWLRECLQLHPSIRVHSAERNAHETATAYLRRLTEASDAVHGDIGSIGTNEFAELRAAFGDRCRLVVLTGDPVQRYAGSIAFSKEVGRHWPRAQLRELWSSEPFDQLFGPITRILAEDDDHVPAHYALHVARSPEDIERSGAFAAHLNALLTSDKEWDALVRHITGARVVDFGTRWRTCAKVCPNVAHAPLLRSPREVWEGLTEKQRRVFSLMVTAAARERYARLGYDLSWIPHEPRRSLIASLRGWTFSRPARTASAGAPSAFNPDVYRRDGFQTVTDAFTPAERAKLRADWLDHYARALAAGREVGGNPVEVLQQVPRFLQELVIHPRVLAIPQSVFGPNIALYHVRLLLKDKAYSGPAWCHHDAPYYGGKNKISVFIALDRADEANGSLFFVRGSHHFGLMQGDYYKDQMGKEQTGAINLDLMTPDNGLEHECPALETGDLVATDMFTWHYSKAATEERVRAILQIIYSSASDAYANNLISGRWENDHYITRADGRLQIRPRSARPLWKPA